MADTTSILSCHGLWKLYGDDPAGFMRRHANAPDPDAVRNEGYVAAVRDVSLEVCLGEILVVMGLSGSGKSTLVRCLSRLIEPTCGEVFFQGQDLLRASAAELIDLRRHRMGMVFQHFALLPHRTALQNVALPLEVQGVDRRAREENAKEMLGLVGLGGRENYYPRELSGGQQQRVGIARSLAVKPDVWFLDEPFSALDPLIRREMQEEFLRLQVMLKKTIIFITHDFDEAIRLADRIAIMYSGGIDQIGTPESIVLDPQSDYVREFTNDVAREKILSVGSVMEPFEPGMAAGEEGILLEDKLIDAAKTVLNSEKPVRVLDEAGMPVGMLGRNKVIEVLFGDGK